MTYTVAHSFWLSPTYFQKPVGDSDYFFFSILTPELIGIGDVFFIDENSGY